MDDIHKLNMRVKELQKDFDDIEQFVMECNSRVSFAEGLILTLLIIDLGFSVYRYFFA